MSFSDSQCFHQRGCVPNRTGRIWPAVQQHRAVMPLEGMGLALAHFPISTDLHPQRKFIMIADFLEVNFSQAGSFFCGHGCNFVVMVVTDSPSSLPYKACLVPTLLRRRFPKGSRTCCYLTRAGIGQHPTFGGDFAQATFVNPSSSLQAEGLLYTMQPRQRNHHA